MAINPFQKQESKLPELLGIVNTLTNMGVLPGQAQSSMEYNKEKAAEQRSQNETTARRNDPNSDYSRAAFELLPPNSPARKYAGKISGAELENIIKGRGEGMSPIEAKIKEIQIAKGMGDLEDRAYSKTTAGRLEKLGGEQKARLDNAKLGLVAARGMADSLNAGSNTFSVIGDNDFTQQRALFEEALGRMQSGGAISKDEENRFKKMAPSFWDTPEMRQKKLAQIQTEMESRIKTLGFTPEQIGVSPGASQNMLASTPTPIVQMNGANASQPSQRDLDAINWAKASPKDPRAAKILQMNGVK